jgi:hypothetical protein
MDETDREKRNIPTDFTPTTVAEEQREGWIRTAKPVGGEPPRPNIQPGHGSGHEGDDRSGQRN